MKRRDFIAGALSIGAAGGALRLEAALPVSGLDHVNIRVPDARRAAEFYIKLFGVQVARAPNAKAQTANRLFRRHESHNWRWQCRTSNHPQATTESYWATRPRHARRDDFAWENRSSCWDRHPAENLSVWESLVSILPPSQAS